MACANARHANPAAFFQLDDRLTDVRVQLAALSDSTGSGHPDSAGIEQARDQVLRLDQRLKSRGPEWASGLGFISAWRLLHQAEQALIEIQPRHQVVAGAVNDALRLSGSDIEHTDQLLSRISEAMKVMSPPGVEVYYQHSSPSPTPRPSGSTPVDSAPEASSEQPAADDSRAQDAKCSHLVARSVLRNVRSCIDDYRDNARAGLVRSRNILLATLALTAFGTYALLATMIVQRVPRAVVVAAAVYFGIGAIVGLFNRLRTASHYSIRDNPLDVEDFGLSAARGMAAPIFSGLAAVIGVFVLSQFQLSISGSPVPTGPSPQLAGAPGIADVFNLRTNSLGLLLAAILGTTPELLAGYLHGPVADLKRGLKSSEPSGYLARPALRNGAG
jgi:hypothetical protein